MSVLHIPGTDIIKNRIAKQIIPYLIRRHIPGILSNDKRQFYLVIQTVHQPFVGRNPLSVCSCFIDPFGKINCMGTFSVKFPFSKTGRFLCMFHVIDSQTNNILFRHRYGSQQTHFLQSGRSLVGVWLLSRSIC